MQILFIGDIFGSPGRKIVRDHLPHLMETHKVDLLIANAENAAGGFGLTPAIAEELFDLGCDVLTTGNHVWDKREIMDYESRPELCRDKPAGPRVYADQRRPLSQGR
jgi:2',3'-cyclic-nucleotide 2'-phosphodiesterase